MKTSTNLCFKRSKSSALRSALLAAEALSPSATPKLPGRPPLPGLSSSGHWDHSHYLQKKLHLLRSRRPPLAQSLPRHQGQQTRSLKPVANPRSLSLQGTWSALRPGPQDLPQNKEGLKNLQSQHTWPLSRRTGSTLSPT